MKKDDNMKHDNMKDAVNNDEMKKN